MALHYLLDGYNIIKQVPHLAKQPWEEGRASLVKIIENDNLQGSANNQVTIFFDGRPGRFDTPGSAKVKVLFTDQQSADDCIKTIVTEAQNKKSYMVVTDDREIRYYVRSLGAQVLKVSEFLSKDKSHQDKRFTTRKAAAREKDLKVSSPNLENKITAELEQIWLGKKKNKNP